MEPIESESNSALDNTTNFTARLSLWAQGTETATPDYALVNLGLGFDVTRERELSTDSEIRTLVVRTEMQKLFSVNFIVTNLLDRAYQSHLSRLKYAPDGGVQGAGINVLLVAPLSQRWAVAEARLIFALP